jgi:hypothetical protein
VVVRRRVTAGLTSAVALAALAALGLPAASSSAVDAAGRPTDVTATFVQWHDGEDEFELSWTPPVEPVGHYAVFEQGGPNPPTPPSTPLATVDPGQSTATVDVPVDTSATYLHHDEASFAVYAWNDTDDAWAASDPVVVPTVLGAALTVTPESGVAGKVRVSWDAPAAGDRVVLHEDGVTGPVTLPDDTQAGSLVVDIGTSAYSPRFSLAEQVIADPDQTSPVRLADGAAAPRPVGGISVRTVSPTTLGVTATMPAGCPDATHWLNHCINVRVVAKEGTAPPESPTDGVAVWPAPDAAATDLIGGTLSGLSPRRTYTVAAFNTTWTGAPAYSPAVTQQVDLLDGAVPHVLQRPPATVTYGGAATFEVRLTRASDGTALSAYPVRLYDVVNLGIAHLLAQASTGSTGLAVLTVRPAHTTRFSVLVPEQPWYVSESDPGYQPVVSVRPVLSLTSAHHTYGRGRTATLSGTLSPHLATTIRLQHYSGGAWHTVATTRSSSTGRYGLHVRLTSAGRPAYRVERSGDSLLVTGVSATLHLTVR